MPSKKPKLLRIAKLSIILLGLMNLLAGFGGIVIRFFPNRNDFISNLLIAGCILSIASLHLGIYMIKRK